MPRVSANGIEIEYETHGDSSGRPLLVIRGLGTQLIQWPQGLLEALVEAGHYVIAPDNRDVGLSTHLHEMKPPPMSETLEALRGGHDPGVPYLISDMAQDMAELLQALGIDRAHVLGMSLGGAVVQQMAIDHPDRVTTLISVFSTPGAPGLPGPSPEALAVLVTPTPEDREGYIEHAVKTATFLNGPVHPIDRRQTAELAGRCYDRAFDPMGVARQLAAISASPDRTAALGKLDVPTLVIHGDADHLVRVECGRATAEAIPGAKLEIIEGMGHNLPPGLLPQIAAMVASHTA